jgi:ethanolamine ammonia-lyase small subunit
MDPTQDREISPSPIGQSDPWVALRKLTTARIALGRAGGSLRTRSRLDFRLAHAKARDAVWSPFHPEMLASELRAYWNDVVVLESAVADRAEYLRRPDLGRRLAAADREKLLDLLTGKKPYDLVIIVSDGLSTLAATTQAAPLISELLPLLTTDGWTIAPLVVVRNGRVAIQDEIGEICRARISLMLIGERPGLGSTDSMGAYFTYSPGKDTTDADRNCVSNIRQEGITPTDAARKLFHLLSASRKLGISGVQLKDDAVGILGEGRPAPIAIQS